MALTWDAAEALAWRRLGRRAGLAMLAALLASCSGQGVGRAPLVQKPAVKPGAGQALVKPSLALPGAPLVRLPGAEVRPFEAILGGGSVGGSVSLRLVQGTSFANSSAPYRLLAPTAAGFALVAAGRLDEALFTRSGQVVNTTTALDGSFSFAEEVPATRSYVLTATLAGGHRLAAVVPGGATSVPVDEASTMIAEMARWQLRPERLASAPERPALADIDATTALFLQAGALDLVSGADIEGAATGTGIPALRAGAGALMRHLYVEAFGTRITSGGTSVPPAANVASDTWTSLLGYRPLALQLMAGSGERANGNSNDGKVAAQAPLFGPSDAAQDTSGDLWIAQQDGDQFVYVPNADRPGPVMGRAGPFQAGRAYLLPATIINGQDVVAYNTAYDNATVAGVPPSLGDDFNIIRPSRLLVAPGDHLVVSSSFGYRVFFVPRTPTTAFGRVMQANRLYTIAGTGLPPQGEPLGDGAGATGAPLDSPSGLVRDGVGNLFFLESGLAGVRTGIRMVRADGVISSLPLTLDGDPYAVGVGSKGLALSPDGQWIYLADAARHAVLRFPKPDDTAIADVSATADTLATAACERILGLVDTAGFLNTDAGVPYPSLYEVASGVDAEAGPTVQVLLNRPTGLSFTAEGDLVVADAGNRRLRMLRGGKVYTLAGGFDVDRIHGDARLCDFPTLSNVRLTPDGNLLVVDDQAQRVRKLWTLRGILPAI